MVARFIAQIIVLGVQAVGRAFSQALRQEYQASVAARKAAEEAGRDGTKAAKASSFTGMSIQEAQQILNLKDIKEIATIRKNYIHLFKVNEKKAGGSFYLLSKIVRAKERIELEVEEVIVSDSDQPSDGQQTETKSDSSSKQS